MSTTQSEGTEGARQQRGREETLGPWIESQRVATTSAVENEEMVITHIRATDVALGLRRLPAGFYAVVHHSGREWRTENKSSSVTVDVVEWSHPIPIPSDLSATVSLEVYASFEFQPMLGAGEQLRKLTMTVEQLMDCSAKDDPFTFFSKDGDVVSPCSSIFVTVKHRKCESNASSYHEPHHLATDIRRRLGDATTQGHSALSHYRKHGERRDLERSIKEFQRALRICPMDNPCRAAAQSNLATATFIHSQLEADASFEVPLGLYRNALAARPAGHLDRPLTLIQLAVVHSARFARGHDEAEQARVVALLREAIELSPQDSHERRAASFVLQVHAACRTVPAKSTMVQRSMDADPWISSALLMERFERFGDLTDLHQAITILELLVRSTSVWDDRYCAALGNLGVARCHRFDHLGELKDLEDAILLYRDAASLTPDGHTDKLSHLSNLGSSLTRRFERLGGLRDLEEAISQFKDAILLTPDSHPAKPGLLGNVGNSFSIRFGCLGKLSDLEEAISMHRNAVVLTPDGHADRPNHLSDLGTALILRFERLGELSDLEHAISILTYAVNLTLHGHPRKPGCLVNLGHSLLTRFLRLGELGDIESAILILRDAVGLIPHAHPDKPACLSALGAALKARFERTGDLDDIEGAISALRNAVDTTPHGYPGKPTRLTNLGNCFRARFECVGEPSDLDSAISSLRDAVNLTPDGHPQRPTCLNNLACSFTTRFRCFWELGDLEEAISMLKDAIDLTPDDDVFKLGCLNNLGHALIARFAFLSDLIDLEDAISRFRSAVSLTPDGHPAKSHVLANLGGSYFMRFRTLGDRGDLEDAILMSKQAADLIPDGHPQRISCLNNLGSFLRTRFELLGEPSDLDSAIQMLKDAIHLTPDGHPDMAKRFWNLGMSYIARFENLGRLSDVEDAIPILGDAIHLVPHFHDKLAYQSDLGDAFMILFESRGELSHLERAMSLYSRVASCPVGPTPTRFKASMRWISCARHMNHHSLLNAYSVTIGLLPQLAWIGLPLTQRYSQLMAGTGVVREAAAAALDAGYPESAVEWLEQGRSIVWGELFQLRSSHDELSSTYPDHARRLQELSSALEHAGTVREKSLSVLSEQTLNAAHRAPESLEAVRYRMLAIQRDKLLEEIRGLPGFERFLLQKRFSHLRRSAHSGPVVILNAAECRCDALVILADVDHAIHVPLPMFTFERSSGLQNMLEKLLGHARSEDRKGGPATRGGVSWESLLSTLWNCVVKPVLNALAFSTAEDLSRIFWCPTGPFAFLPIHAAGLYGTQHSQPGHKVSDFVVSSYIPTLSILAPSTNPGMGRGNGLRLLAVQQPPSDGLPHLPGVATELGHIKAVIRNSPSARATLLESSSGTVEEVLDLMKEADWVHFACHGIQDSVDSGLCLADGRRLKLRDIVALSRPPGGLAFLSACQTATGEELLSDEAIHIAAGMLFAGYGGVIGTMWSISDKFAPRVARDVYEQLLGNGTPDSRNAAMALHRAIERLRAGGKASFVTWIPFIHVGL